MTHTPKSLHITSSEQVDDGILLTSDIASSEFNVANKLTKLDANTRLLQANSFSPVPENNLGASRVLGTIYQNGSRPRLVSVSVLCKCGVTGSSKAFAYIGIGASSPPVGLWSSGGLNVGIANEEKYFNLVQFVPANYYYEVDDSITNTGVVTICAWNEVDL